MNMSEQQAATALDPGKNSGFFSNLFSLYLSPAEGFLGLLRKPRFWAALGCLIVLNLAFVGTWVSKMDAAEFAKIQQEESGRADKMTPEQRAAAISIAAKITPIFSMVIAVVGPLVGILVIALVYWGIFRFFYASDLTYSSALTVVSSTMLALAVIIIPLSLLVFSLKGDWNLNPGEILLASPAAFVEKTSVSKPLWATLTSLDLFSFWHLFLFAVGFGVATRKPTGSTVGGVVAPWIVIVLIKIGLAAIF